MFKRHIKITGIIVTASLLSYLCIIFNVTTNPSLTTVYAASSNVNIVLGNPSNATTDNKNNYLGSAEKIKRSRKIPLK